MLGEALSELDFKALKNLEKNLEKGISRIRSKKAWSLPFFPLGIYGFLFLS